MSSYLTSTTMQREKVQIWFLQTITNVATTNTTKPQKEKFSCHVLCLPGRDTSECVDCYLEVVRTWIPGN